MITRRKVWWVISAISIATLVSLLIIHFTPLTKIWARFLLGDWPDARSDTLIVLGSEIESDGLLGPTSYLRAEYVVRAYRERPYRTIIITGGRSGSAPQTISEAMRDFIVASGVPASVIRTENRATSTRENALFVKPMLQGITGRPALLTSDFHMWRARHVFEKAGIPVVDYPVPDVLKRSNHIVNRWISFWTLVLETAKIGYYAWERWV